MTIAAYRRISLVESVPDVSGASAPTVSGVVRGEAQDRPDRAAAGVRPRGVCAGGTVRGVGGVFEQPSNFYASLIIYVQVLLFFSYLAVEE